MTGQMDKHPHTEIQCENTSEDLGRGEDHMKMKVQQANDAPSYRQMDRPAYRCVDASKIQSETTAYEY